MQVSSPSEEAVAQEYLTNFFRHGASVGLQIPEMVDHSVTLLRLHPQLAKKTYMSRRYPVARLPLFMLAEHGATLDQIQCVCGLGETKNDTSLLDAECSTRMNTKPELIKIMEGGKARIDVLFFLVNAFPILIQQVDSVGRYPVHTFLARWAYRFYNHLQSRCDELALHMMQKYPASCDLRLFYHALHSNCNDEVVDFILQVINQGPKLPRFAVDGALNGTVPFSLREFQAISKILPKLQELSLDLSPTGPGAEAFCYAMESIAETNCLQTLNVQINGDYFENHGTETSKAMQRALATPSLEHVVLKVMSTPERRHDYECGIFSNGLTSRTSPLDSVNIYFPGILSVLPILVVLNSKKCPKSVELLIGSWEHQDDPVVLDTPSESSLESFTMFVGYQPSFTTPDQRSILRMAVRAPYAQRSECHPNRMDIEYLRCAQRLEKLELISGAGIHYASICRLLQNNTSLRNVIVGRVTMSGDNSSPSIVECLEENATLESLQCVPYNFWEKSVQEKIGYYLHLNRRGRKQTRDLSLSRTEFVGLLSSVIQEGMEDINVQSNLANPCEQHPGSLSILFGLLRENPNLWTSSDKAERVSLLKPAEEPAGKKARTC